jgi:hypothetical protein
MLSIPLLRWAEGAQYQIIILSPESPGQGVGDHPYYWIILWSRKKPERQSELLP